MEACILKIKRDTGDGVGPIAELGLSSAESQFFSFGNGAPIVCKASSAFLDGFVLQMSFRCIKLKLISLGLLATTVNVSSGATRNPFVPSPLCPLSGLRRWLSHALPTSGLLFSRQIC